MKVSIIMPLYNIGQYILSSLDSICQQTYSDIEVILIDDCSTDNTYQKVDDFIGRYTGNIEFRLLKNEKNCGPGVSRNKGIVMSTGEYLMFVDGDDLLPCTCVEKMVSKTKGMDVVISNFSFILPDDTKDSLTPIIHEDYPLIPTGQYSGNNTIYKHHKKFVGVPWGKLVNRDFLLRNGIYFSEAYREEDSCWWQLCLYCVQNVYVINEPLYYYRKGHDSLMTVNNLDYYLFRQKLINIKHIYQFLVQKNLYKGVSYNNFQANRTHLIKWMMRFTEPTKVEKRLHFAELRNLCPNKSTEFFVLCDSIKKKMNNLYILLPLSIGYRYMQLLSVIKK